MPAHRSIRGPGAASRFAVVKSTPLHEQVADGLRNMIVEGELRPGQRLPERDLCDIMKVSRTPLREAIKLLASEGFLRLSQNRGATVTEFDPSELNHTIAVLRVLEVEAVRLACAEASDDEIRTICALHEQLNAYSQKNDNVRYFRANQLFHELIVQAAHNPVLQDAHARLHIHLKRIRYQRMHTTGFRMRSTFLREHAEIAEALSRRDAAAAADAVGRHMDHVHEMVSAPAEAAGGASGAQP